MHTTVNYNTVSIDGDRMYLCSPMLLNERRKSKGWPTDRTTESKEKESEKKKNFFFWLNVLNILNSI